MAVKGKLIFVVEDSRATQAYIKLLLESSGYRVETASDGKEGLSKIQTARPDLVITDLEMPEMTGVELIANLRSLSDFKTLPIVLLTARGGAEVRQEGHGAGADNYLSKPFSDLELLTIIRNLIALKAREQELLADLERAREIQAKLLPREIPRLPGLNIATRYAPMDLVGGDLYDFTVHSDGSLGVFIADVTGHGMAAAMIASMVKLVLTLTNSFAHPAELLATLNQHIHGRIADYFLTASYALISPDRRNCLLAVGGHEPMLIVRRGQLTSYKGAGRMLGVLSDSEFPQSEIALEKGDRLLFYTDGLREAGATAGREVGRERLGSYAIDFASQPLDEQLSSIIQSAREHISPATIEDDVTLLGIEITT